METIDELQLRDENIHPDEKVLQTVLGKSYAAYIKLLELLKQNEMSHEWRYYRDGKAWLCKIQKKKKTIIWMSAWNGFMKATIYFPIRLLDHVFDLDISKKQKEAIKTAKEVGKSKPCTFEIRDTKIFGDLEKVMLLKIKSK